MAHDLNYYLGPDFQNDSSLMRNLAKVLVAADQAGISDAFESEFFLMLVELNGLIQRYSNVSAKYGSAAPHPADVDTRKRVAQEFVRQSRHADGVKERVSVLVDYLASMIAGEAL